MQNILLNTVSPTASENLGVSHSVFYCYQPKTARAMLLAVHTLKIHCLDSLLMCYNIVLKNVCSEVSEINFRCLKRIDTFSYL